MLHPGSVSTLAGQLVSVTARMREPGLGAGEVAKVAAVAQSLRVTLASIVQRRHPRDVGAQGFLLQTDGEGYPTVRFRSGLLPVSPSFVLQVWKDAGTELGPGQAILLVAALGREIAEEALARNSAEDLRLKDEKLKLVAACLHADSLAEGPRECPLTSGRCRSGSAA